MARATIALSDFRVSNPSTYSGGNRYDPGTPITIRAEFRVDGTKVRPTTVALEVVDPTGASQTYTLAGTTLTEREAGVYERALTPASVGVWEYQIVGTGTAEGNARGRFFVRRSPF